MIAVMAVPPGLVPSPLPGPLPAPRGEGDGTLSLLCGARDTKTSGSCMELPLDLGELERLAIAEALRRVQGNRTHAARLLGIGLRTLRNKLRAYREAGVNVEPAEAAAGQLWPSASGATGGIPQPWRGTLRARTSQEKTSEESS